MQQPPQAGLIFGHWGEGNRAEFVDEAIVLTRLGFVSLCLDAPVRRPAEYEPQRTQPQMELQWIADVRRGVDVLLEAFSLPPEQVGYVGHSYGATLGGVLAGVEHRISAFVLMAGWYALSELARTSTIPVLAEARNKIPRRFLRSIWMLWLRSMPATTLVMQHHRSSSFSLLGTTRLLQLKMDTSILSWRASRNRSPGMSIAITN